MYEAIKILRQELKQAERNYDSKMYELNEEKKIIASLVSGVESARARRDSIRRALEVLQEMELED